VLCDSGRVGLTSIFEGRMGPVLERLDGRRQKLMATVVPVNPPP
jgi:hypothetical protein